MCPAQFVQPGSRFDAGECDFKFLVETPGDGSSNKVLDGETNQRGTWLLSVRLEAGGSLVDGLLYY